MVTLKRLALLTLASVAGMLAGCGHYQRFADAPIVDRDRHDVLAPYEAADWPIYLRKLALPHERNYVVFSYIPTRHPIDLSSLENSKRTTLRQLTDPGFDTKIGHTLIGWQCGRYQGMTSMSGAFKPSPFQMLQNGWGLTAVLSTFTDGELKPEGEHRLANLEALAEGRGVVTAVEVSARACRALRNRLRAFVTHPNQPATKFGLLVDPERFEGAGCISFGFFLMNAVGVMQDIQKAVEREIPVHSAMIGRGEVIPQGVLPYRPPSPDCCDRAVSLGTLLAAPWARGPVVDRVRMIDGELLLAALAGARREISTEDDWRFARVLPETDPAIARATSVGGKFASSYPVRRIADPGGVEALVLELW